MGWKVVFTKKTMKALSKLPDEIQAQAAALTADISTTGPVQGTWSNYSKLKNGYHHCHLKYRYVAVWIETNKGIEVEVTYVGSRENAPY